MTIREFDEQRGVILTLAEHPIGQCINIVKSVPIGGGFHRQSRCQNKAGYGIALTICKECANE